MIEHLLARLDFGEAAGDEQAEVDGATTVDAVRARLVRLALSLRELLTGHAGTLELIMSGPLDGPNAMRLNEALLDSFSAAGLALDDAAPAAYALQAFALGSIALESAAEIDVEADAATSEPLIMTDAPGAALWTDLARFPLSEQTAVVAAERTSTAQFVWGVEGLLAGLLARG